MRKPFAVLALGILLSIATLPRTKAQGPVAQQSNDAGYTEKIKQFTTEPYFLTDLVDHLPASPTVPTPEKILGYIVGAPGHLTYSKDLYRYYRELARVSSRVHVFTAPEHSEEGKEQLLVVISDEANLAQLDHYKGITAKLADPRHVTAPEAQSLIAEGKPFYWVSGSIHSTETGSPEMLMELAYRLAVDESPRIQAIRKNAFVLITPTLEVDGHDRMVDLANYHHDNPNKPTPQLLYWGKYVAHDNNRDGIGMALALSRNMMHTFLEYHPQVLHDLHESVPFLYISTGTGPYNAWLDPLVIDEWHELAYHEIAEMTSQGVPGVWTHGFYDGWAPNYMFYVANGHNSIGRFYETFGNMYPETLDRTVGSDAKRRWDRPNPPMARVKWSLRNNINMQESALLSGIPYVALNHEAFLSNFYLKSKRSVAKATNEGPTAWVIPGDTPRPLEAADMVNHLRMLGVEVHTATAPFTIKETPPAGDAKPEKPVPAKERKFPAGSYIIRMDQPYSRMADMLLDRQYYNPSDPQPYDDTGWTLGALRNVQTERITEKSVLTEPMNLLTTDVKITGKVTGAATPIAYVINHNAESALMTLRYRLKNVTIQVAEREFKVGSQSYNAGSFVIPTTDSPTDLPAHLQSAVSELGLTATAVDTMPTVPTHAIGTPRIAILHNWLDTQNDGWFRIEFDRLQIPYAYISEHVIRDTSDLRRRFDVIIYPPTYDSSQSLLNGIPRYSNDPLPWKKSDKTPNIGLSPDQTEDMRGGMEMRGVEHLRKFIEEGGLFIGVGSAAHLPVDFGFTDRVEIENGNQLRTAGSIFNASFVDRKSPISYGYAETLAIYFNQAPLLKVSKLLGTDDSTDENGAAKPSGRGSAEDPDVVPAMPQTRPAPPKPKLKPGEDPPITEEQRLFLGPFLPPASLKPRVVLQFAEEQKDLLVSGLLAGGSELVKRPAVLDAPVGKGHVVLFANNPMWRHQTQGSFFLLFNAALNFDHLDVGKAAPQSR